MSAGSAVSNRNNLRWTFSHAIAINKFEAVFTPAVTTAFSFTVASRNTVLIAWVAGVHICVQRVTGFAQVVAVEWSMNIARSGTVAAALSAHMRVCLQRVSLVALGVTASGSLYLATAANVTVPITHFARWNGSGLGDELISRLALGVAR